MKNPLNPKSIDKVAIVFLILFLVGLLFTLSKQFANFALPENDRFLMVSMQMRFVWWVYAIFGYVIYLGSAVWLFLESKKTESNKWVWAVLGLFGGLMAVILWYLRGLYLLAHNYSTTEKH